jgi:uncharacterized heparinase superfamily protein
MTSNLRKRFAKLRGLPPTELLEVLRFKAGVALQSELQDFRLCVLQKIWPKPDVCSVSGLRNDIQFFGLDVWASRKPELAKILQGQLSFAPQELKESADQHCSHVFDLLGSGPVKLGEQIDWHRDFKSGVKWEPRYFKRIRDIELSDASDIKVPWELSRFYHFVPLGVAYWLSGDEKYPKEFVAQIRNWIESNPPYRGVNWHCAMEVAIRAINWIWGYYFFKDSPHLGAATRRLIASSLAVHGEYIWHNLEVAKRVINGRYVRHNGNHYVSDLVGLLFLGLVLPGPQANRWLEWSLQELNIEMQTQVLSDGVHWELSPSYHRLVLELVLPVVILCSQNNVPVPQPLYQTCQAMAEYVMYYLKPDGLCPLVRDADDGRICLLGRNDYRDHRHLLALAGVFFSREDFFSQAGGISAEIVWMLGISGVEKAQSMSGLRTGLASKAFPRAGFYILRDGEDAHVFIACADVGMKGSYGGHAHNDCLSFELFSGGTTFITDCGTFIYSGDSSARNQFRSTASHNTARIDQTEINQFDESELFSMQNDAKPKVLEWHTESDFDFLLAEHFGYTRLKSPVVHRRSFRLDRVAKCLLLKDNFEGKGLHCFELFFHFFPGIQVEKIGRLVFRASTGKSAITLSFSAGGSWASRLEPCWVSQRYGRKERGWRIVLDSHVRAPVAIETLIRFRSEAKQEDGSLSKENCAIIATAAVP